MELKTKSTQVYEILKKQIIRDDLKAGSRITIRAIADKISAGQMPVQYALNRLVENGLVNKTPGGHYHIVALTVKDAQEIFDLRVILEVYALNSVVASAGNNKDLQELKERIESRCDKPKHEKKIEFLKIDQELHWIIIEKSRNKRLQDIYSSKIFNFFVLLLQQMEHVARDIEKAQREHKALLEAILAKDLRKAKKKLKEHLGRARKEVIGHLEVRRKERT